MFSKTCEIEQPTSYGEADFDLAAKMIDASGSSGWKKNLLGGCAFCAAGFGLVHILHLALPFVPTLAPRLADKINFDPYSARTTLLLTFGIGAALVYANHRWLMREATPLFRRLITTATIVFSAGSYAYNAPHMYDINLTINSRTDGMAEKRKEFLLSAALTRPDYIENLCADDTAKRPAMTAFEKSWRFALMAKDF